MTVNTCNSSQRRPNGRTGAGRIVVAVQLGTAIAALLLFAPAGRTVAAQAPGAAAPAASATTAPAGKGAKDRTRRDYSPDCLRAGCHGELNDTPWVHGPVAIGSCDVCHRALPQGEHKFELTRSKEEVCTYCHRMVSGKFTHQVVTDTGCTKCHNPHGGTKRNLLVTQNVAKLCGECHDPTRPLPVAADGKPRKASEPKDRQDLPVFTKVHDPVAKGDCLACHETHNANHEGRLVKEQQELCLTCHEKVAKSLIGASHVHKPVTEKCTKCHVAHAGNVERLLTQEPKALCLSCHKPVADSLETGFVVPAAAGNAAPSASPQPAVPGQPAPAAAPPRAAPTQPAVTQAPAAATVVAAPAADAKPAPAETRLHLHAAIRDAKTCLLCHVAHASSTIGLTRSPIDQACYTCHDKEIRLTTSNRVIPDIKSELAKARFQHKPVHDGRCAECHLGHASPYSQLLSQAFPVGLYVPFTESTYALCFACHDRRLATEGHTVQTGFRNGDLNLHYVHVMDEDPAAEAAEAAKAAPGEALKKAKLRKGRSCGLCHAPHSSMQAKQIRESIQYGPEEWKLAIHFEQTATGGTCTTACHKTKSYSNQQPPAPPKEPIPAKP